MKSIDADAALALKTAREFKAACQNRNLGSVLLIGLLWDTMAYADSEVAAIWDAHRKVAWAVYDEEERKV